MPIVNNTIQFNSIQLILNHCMKLKINIATIFLKQECMSDNMPIFHFNVQTQSAVISTTISKTRAHMCLHTCLTTQTYSCAHASEGRYTCSPPIAYRFKGQPQSIRPTSNTPSTHTQDKGRTRVFQGLHSTTPNQHKFAYKFKCTQQQINAFSVPTIRYLVQPQFRAHVRTIQLHFPPQQSTGCCNIITFILPYWPSRYRKSSQPMVPVSQQTQHQLNIIYQCTNSSIAICKRRFSVIHSSLLSCSLLRM